MYHLDDLSTGSFPPDTPYYSLSAENYWTLAGETNYWTLAGESNFTPFWLAGMFGGTTRATKDERATCGRKPIRPTGCSVVDCNKQKNKSRPCCTYPDAYKKWDDCVQGVREYNANVLKSGNIPPDSTQTPPPDDASRQGGGTVQQAGMPVAGGKTLMWVIIGLAVLVALYFAYKKFAAKKQ